MIEILDFERWIEGDYLFEPVGENTEDYGCISQQFYAQMMGWA